MSDAMLYALYLQEQEQKKKKSRRITGQIWVDDGDAEKTAVKIRDELGPRGFDCKVSDHDDDYRVTRLDVWCDATPDYMDELMRNGFVAVIERMIKPTEPDLSDLGSRVEVTYMAKPVAA